MRTIARGSLLGLTLGVVALLMTSTPGYAGGYGYRGHHGHRGHHGIHRGFGSRHHRGHGHHGHGGHGSRFYLGFVPSYLPHHGYGRRYAPPYRVHEIRRHVVVEEPPVYIQRETATPSQGWWYYCESAGGYYPTVSSCPEPWVRVAPREDG